MTEQTSSQASAQATHRATLHTTIGDIEIDLFGNHAPITVRNFVELAKGDKEWIDPTNGQPSTGKYYDDVVFHRIIPDFMIQGGDRTGTGRGGPGYVFADEFHPELVFTNDNKYLLAMANAGRDTNGSQFFITTAPTPWLSHKHTIFGEVRAADSRAVVDTLGSVPTGPGDRPRDEVRILTVDVVEL